MSSNIAQNYPYTHETEPERAAAVLRACTTVTGLRERIEAEATPLPPAGPEERWWVWVCPIDGEAGRLHVAGYARDRHALYTVCDRCGKSFLR